MICYAKLVICYAKLVICYAKLVICYSSLFKPLFIKEYSLQKIENKKIRKEALKSTFCQRLSAHNALVGAPSNIFAVTY